MVSNGIGGYYGRAELGLLRGRDQGTYGVWLMSRMGAEGVCCAARRTTPFGRIVDVIDMANTMANRADRVAACKVPPALTSE